MTAVFGSGAAILLGGLASLVAWLHKHLPSQAQEWARVTAIVLMGLAGIELAYVGFGQWVSRVIGAMASAAGPAGRDVLVVLALTLLLVVGVALWKRHSLRAMWVAALAPMVFAVFATGFFHQVNATIGALAHQVTAIITSSFGG